MALYLRWAPPVLEAGRAGGLGLVGRLGALAALFLLILFDLLIGVIVAHGFLLGGVDNLSDSLQNLIGGDVAQLLAVILPALALLGHNVHSLLDDFRDVGRGGLDGGGVLVVALGLGLLLFLQGLLDTGLDFSMSSSDSIFMDLRRVGLLFFLVVAIFWFLLLK